MQKKNTISKKRILIENNLLKYTVGILFLWRRTWENVIGKEENYEKKLEEVLPELCCGNIDVSDRGDYDAGCTGDGCGGIRYNDYVYGVR